MTDPTTPFHFWQQASHHGMDLFFYILTSLVTLIVILVIIKAIASSKRDNQKNTFSISSYNEHLDNLQKKLEKHLPKNQRRKKTKKKNKLSRKRLFFIPFFGDMQATQSETLKEIVDMLLPMIKSSDEVLVGVNSCGGTVHDYGYAANQLLRIRDSGAFLTVAIDKVAASGGYMMASCANRIIAAPFAFVGSIGVLIQRPNFHRLLKKNSIDYEIISAGEYKTTLNVFGPNTASGRKKAQEDANLFHRHFKNHIKTHRPIIDIEKVATGEVWPASEAIHLKLVDQIITSDQYLMERSTSTDIFTLKISHHKSFLQRIKSEYQSMFDSI